MSDRIKGSALTMGGAACWGVSGCMGQYLFTREGMDSTWLVPIRLFLAGVILCGFFFIKDRKTLFDPWNVRKNPRNAIDLLVYGLAGVSCCQFTPDAAGLGVFDGRHHVFAHLPPVADRLCADGDGRVRHLHGGCTGQCAGVQSVHVRCAAHRPPEGQSLQLCRAGHGGHHQHAGAGLALYAVGCAGLRLYLFDAGAAEPARKTEKLNILRNTPAQV